MTLSELLTAIQQELNQVPRTSQVRAVDVLTYTVVMEAQGDPVTKVHISHSDRTVYLSN